MNKVERVGISIEQTLLASFDKFIETRGYANRSEAVRDLIRTTLAEQKLTNPAAKAVAGIFVIYDHHATELSHKLLELQHNHVLQTISSTHVHLDHHNCLEIIILKGKVGDIEQIGERLISLKGVKLGKINIMATDI